MHERLNSFFLSGNGQRYLRYLTATGAADVTSHWFISVESKWSKPNFCFCVVQNPHKYEHLQVWSQSNHTLIRLAAVWCLCVRFFSNPVHLGGGERRGGCRGDLRKKTVMAGGGGWASLLPPCSWLHCAAAVSAGMAPLTICSLIANIRVHFLRHWSGTERWRAELWAFLSLPLCLSRSCSILPGDGGRTHKHTRTHTHELDRRPLTHPAYLYCPAVSNTPSISKHTQVQQWMDAFLLNLPCELTLSHIIHRWCTYVLSTSLIQNFIKSEFVKMIYFLYDVNDILCVSQDVFCFFFWLHLLENWNFSGKHDTMQKFNGNN